MKTLTKLCITVLAASLQLACGGGDDAQKESVAPISQLQPGARFALETPLMGGGSQISHYVMHGVTTEGELVESNRPNLLQSQRIPILESVTRDGRSSTSVVNPATLKQQQRVFFQQLWNATAEHEGTRDPQVILAEIDDLDARIVDLMDDVGASGVTLKEYIAFYDRPDAIPELADKELAELNLREALSDVNSASVFSAESPACPNGLRRVVSESGLYTYCRLPPTSQMARVAQYNLAASAFAATSDEPSLRGLLNTLDTKRDLDTLIANIYEHRMVILEAQIQHINEKRRQANARVEELYKALTLNGQDNQLWRTYCAQHPDLLCGNYDSPHFGSDMTSRIKGIIDSIEINSQNNMIMLQSLLSKRNARLDEISTLPKEIEDRLHLILKTFNEAM